MAIICGYNGTKAKLGSDNAGRSKVPSEQKLSFNTVQGNGMNHQLRNVAAAVLLAMVVSFQADVVHADLQIRTHITERHDRFANDEDLFIGNPYDWSGVSNSGRWATMITPKHFLSAKHSHPANEAEMTFHHGNDPDGASETRTVLGGQTIGGDLWLGELETEVSSDVAIYSILHPSLALGQEINIFGQGNQRVGRNIIDRVIYDFDTESIGAGHTLFYDFDAIDSPTGVGGDEARLRGGDSGGPSFVIFDGAPALVGIHWFIYNEDDDPLRFGDSLTGSGDSFVPGYIPELNDALAGSGYSLSITAVPEPSGVFLVSLLAMSCLQIRRKRSASVIQLRLWQ